MELSNILKRRVCGGTRRRALIWGRRGSYKSDVFTTELTENTLRRVSLAQGRLRKSKSGIILLNLDWTWNLELGTWNLEIDD